MKFFRCGVFLIFWGWVGCAPGDIKAIQTPENAENRTTSVSAPLPTPSTRESKGIFWNRQIKGIDLLWDDKDLYWGSEKKKRIFSDFARNAFKRYVKESEAKFINKHTFKLRAVIDDVISFEHQSIVSFASPAFEWRYTTIDLSKVGKLHYSKELNSETKVFGALSNTKVISLIELFDERDILAALKKDLNISEGLKNNAEEISSIKDLYSFMLDNEVFWEDREFELAPDFLTRFAFFSASNGLVQVRISLSPLHAYNRGEQRYITLDLPVPVRLSEGLQSSKTSFLMKDAEKIFGDAHTEIVFSNEDSRSSKSY